MSVMSTRWFLGIVMGGAILASANCALAQITPDTTLPNNSIVTPDGSIFNITGGTTAGRNLFHSFQQFSVPTGGTAFFQNAADIQNIFSRVTGGSVSNIDGLIRANGTANLFLINPNGIIFGKNASLNIGGSFNASTASSLKFADGFEFSATTPQTTPLLTISVPTGLQFGTNPGLIQVQGSGNHYSQDPQTNPNGTPVSTKFNRSTRPVGLQVQPNKTLALVGGDLVLEGGNLTAPEGQIELGSVAGNGFVSLNPIDKGWSNGYLRVQNFGNIQLSQAASVDASGFGGGDVQVRGRRIALTDGSAIVASTRGAKPGGTLTVVANDAVELTGTDSNHQTFSGLITESLGAGKAGDITISTGKLIVRDSARVASSSFREGAAGKLTVTAPESIELVGSADVTINNNRSVTFSSTLGSETTGIGTGGDVTIATGKLSAINGGQIGSVTFGNGAGGNLLVRASDSVELIGTTPDGNLSSGLYTNVQPEATGAAGNLSLETGKLTVRDRAAVTTSTLGAGSAGTLVVKASSIQLSGTSADGQFPSRLTAQAISTGNAGDLRIETGQLTVDNGAGVTVSSSTGPAGNLTVTAKDIRLNLGRLTAETAMTSTQEGANINLQGLDFLLLQNNSLISAQASNNARGGNITINADTTRGFVVAPPLQNSDIIANATFGNGGNITINARQVFGLAKGQAILGNRTNDIDARSQFNQAGTVTINTPDIDPSRGLVQLPTVVINTPRLVATSCAAFADQGGSTFTVTGRGGLPPSPTEPLTNDVVWTDTRLPSTTGQHSSKKPSAKPHSKPKAESIAIVPATGWVFNGKGEVTLISSASNATSLGSTPATCPRH